MKDQDLRTETARRKRDRKKAQRLAGLPAFTFERVGLAKHMNAVRRVDGRIRREADLAMEAYRRKFRVPFDAAEFHRSRGKTKASDWMV